MSCVCWLQRLFVLLNLIYWLLLRVTPAWAILSVTWSSEFDSSEHNSTPFLVGVLRLYTRSHSTELLMRGGIWAFLGGELGPFLEENPALGFLIAGSSSCCCFSPRPFETSKPALCCSMIAYTILNSLLNYSRARFLSPPSQTLIAETWPQFFIWLCTRPDCSDDLDSSSFCIGWHVFEPLISHVDSLMGVQT